MPCSSPEQPPLVSVFETTLTIHQEVLSVFNVVLQSPTSIVSLVRYPFDFYEFHQKIRTHYPKSKIPFPGLTTPTTVYQDYAQGPRLNKRRSIKNLLNFRAKSNADKLERYLQKCFEHPIVSISTILRDFLSVQREEDQRVPVQKHDPDHSSQSSVTPPSLSPASPSSPPSPPSSPESVKVSLEDYDLLKVLGKGCMGKVLLVQSRKEDNCSRERLYALKAIKKSRVVEQKEVQHTRAERDILARLRGQSPFLIRMHYAFQTPTQLFLVLDYFSGGDIATQMSTYHIFTPERTRFYAAEILAGLAVLHRHGIVYRDLKPENVLIGRDGHIVLTDFGLSKIFPPQQYRDEDDLPITTTFCGTAEYLAPEVLLGEPYTFAIDYWSYGTLLYEMLAGITPFWADTHMDMYRRVLEDPLEFPPHFDPVTRDFLSGLLERDPIDRLGWGIHGADEIKAHPFFNEVDWEDVEHLRLEPPYVPRLTSATDLSNFDPAFVSMSPRISESSGSSEPQHDDPFEHFSFDARVDPPVMTAAPDVPSPPHSPRLPPATRMLLRQRNKKKQDNRFSSSSSLLSFTPGEIVRHTDTMPSFFSQQPQQPITLGSSRTAYARKRYSAALSDMQPTPPPHRTTKKRATHPDDEQSSIYSKSSVTLSSIHATTTRAGSDISTDDRLFLRSPHTCHSNDSHPHENHPSPTHLPHNNSSEDAHASPYARPHCPEPGQVRPVISLTASDESPTNTATTNTTNTATTTTRNPRHSLTLSDMA